MPDDQPTVDTRPSRWTLPVLALIVLLGAGLRLYDVTHSLWLDELHTAWCVSGDFSDIAPRARIGNYSPLYFWIVWASTQVFGLTEWGVRFPSLLAGVALIPAAYLFTVRLTRVPAAGLLAALLVALDGMTLGWYSQEARPYALVMLLGLLHIWLFYDLLTQPGWKRRVLFVAATAALFYLHYTAILLLAGEFGWYLWRRIRAGKVGEQPIAYRWHMLATDLVAAAACCLPAWDHLAQISARRRLWSQFVPALSPGEWPMLFSVAFWASPLVLVAYGLRWWALRRPERYEDTLWGADATPDPRPGLAFFLCWYLLPIAVAGATTNLGFAPVLYPRYLLVCFPALPIAAAWAMNLMPRDLRGWYPLVVAITFQFAALPLEPPLESDELRLRFISNYASNGLILHHAEDWRGAVAHVRAADPEGRYPVFLRSGLIEDQLLPQRVGDEEFHRYLLFPISGIYSLDDGRALEPLGKEPNRLLAQEDIDWLASAGGGWMVLRWSGAVDAFVKRVGKELAEQDISCRLAEERQFRGVVVLRFTTTDR